MLDSSLVNCQFAARKDRCTSRWRLFGWFLLEGCAD